MLSENEKKAIEKLNRLTVYEIQKGNIGIPVMIKDLEIVLNLITKLQKENKEKDKQIDLMAEWIFDKDYRENSLLIHRDDYYSNCIKQVKKHFEKLAKEKGE